MKNAPAVSKNKLYVLDTNVLLHDPTSLYRFEEHDVYLTMDVLEELNGKKLGMTELARNARQVIRSLNEITKDESADIEKGFSLQSDAHKGCIGRLYLQTGLVKIELPQDMDPGVADNRILGVVMSLKKQHPGRQVILVSKDINMCIKARVLKLKVEDYKGDMVVENPDLLYSGVMELPANFWETHGEDLKSRNDGSRTIYKIHGPLCAAFFVNQFLTLEVDSKSFRVLECDQIEQTATIATITDYTHAKNAVYGITARNQEQNFLFNLLMDPQVDFVAALGDAGTGKTLLTLASAFQQADLYTKTIVTRALVPVDKDIGFLPGDEAAKVSPWMDGIKDNCNVLDDHKKEVSTVGKKDSDKKEDPKPGHSQKDQPDSRYQIRTTNFMRGRSFQKTFIIIDEAQNLTPKQMKTLITRAGMGTKVICMGNLSQIDTPYLDEGSSGLAFVVERFKGCGLFGAVALVEVERSPLAEEAVRRMK